MIDSSNLTPVLAIFFILAVASKQFGHFFARARLPLITGFLFTGMAVGPSILGLIPAEAIKELRFVDQISLAVIAFASGAELHLKESRGRFKSIGWITAGLVLSTFTLGALTVLALSDHIPFLDQTPTSGRIAVAILAGAILVARSPSSAIAIVAELRAKGPFTQMALGVTVIMDVIVIVIFAVNSSIAVSLTTDHPMNLLFVLLLVGEVLASITLGYAIGKLIALILRSQFYHSGKIGMILLLGYGVFMLSDFFHGRGPFFHVPVDLSLEPLLICMVAGFTITNFTRQHRKFERILHDLEPTVFVAFFTLTGASLDLAVLKTTWEVALILVGVRLTGIMIGSFVGGTIAGDPPRNNRLNWMAFITQAGVGLGLAKEVAVKFPSWGEQFATTLIAVIIINQVVGPPFFKWVLNLVGEAHDKPDSEPEPFDGIRDAVIFGLENNAYSLARQLSSHGWQVKIATRRGGHIAELPDEHGFLHRIRDLSLEELEQLETGRAEAVICMFASDEDSLKVCRLVREHFEVKDLIVRLNDITNIPRFRELGALVVEPTSAMINLLDHFVRAPVATSWIMGMDEEHDVVSLEVRDPTLEGMALHELRLPLDVIMVSIDRMGEVFSPHADTEIALGDSVTLIGSPESLGEATLMFDVDFPMTRHVDSIPAAPPVPVKEKKRRRSERTQVPFVWEMYLDSNLMRARLEVATKGALFKEIADIFAEVRAGIPKRFEAALWDRERRQDTLVGGGLAIPHVILDDLDRTHLGVLTLVEPIDYRAGEKADVIVFMMGPLADRHNYLQLLANTATLCAKANLLEELRKATSIDGLKKTLIECDERAHRPNRD